MSTLRGSEYEDEQSRQFQRTEKYTYATLEKLVNLCSFLFRVFNFWFALGLLSACNLVLLILCLVEHVQ